MSAETHQLHIYFLPMMAPGHMIPMIDIARRFARHGVRATIITTSLNAANFLETIENDRTDGMEIDISLIKFPCQEAGLPEGCENLSSITSHEMSLSFLKALDLLQEPVEKLLQEGHPDGIVAGVIYWWATDLALKFNIPSLGFYGTGFFPLCIYYTLVEHKPHEKVGSDSEAFVVPGLPDVLKLSKRQLMDHIIEGDKDPMVETRVKVETSVARSNGIIVNSFYELEPAYARHYREVLGRKAWHIGPVSLFNRIIKADRGRESSSTDGYCLSWLDSQKPNSVLYVCFGSMAVFSAAQLLEIAKGLESSGQQFVWVVGGVGGTDWLPEEFGSSAAKTESMTSHTKDGDRQAEAWLVLEGRGLMIKGWAPQVLILNHKAVGGFVTHCGWNSILEGVAAGVPMVTWPLSAEQFFNEKLVAEVLKIGIPVGAEEWTKRTDEREPINRERIEKAVAQLMVREDAEGIRSRAEKSGEMAKRAVEKGGSSDADLNSLLEEIWSFKT